jgi:hypothetical protein
MFIPRRKRIIGLSSNYWMLLNSSLTFSPATLPAAITHPSRGKGGDGGYSSSSLSL